MISTSQITTHTSPLPITARSTRLVRVPDLRTFRHTVAALASDGTPADVRNRLVVVPTLAAAAHLTAFIERAINGDGACVLPDFVTRAELYARLGERLPRPSVLLRPPERSVLMGVACRTVLEQGIAPPFRLRAGLITEIVRFYDTLRLNLKEVDTFERLALGMLEPGAADDRGAERLVQQTRFLAAAFREFERVGRASGGSDEHALRRRLLAEPAARPWRHIVVSVGDRGSDPYGLCAADWDLLARIPALERLDIVATDATIAGPVHERMHQVLPGIEEMRVAAGTPSAPVLLVLPEGGPAYVARDREEEIATFARLVRHERPTLERTALVVRRPLPYVYVAREVLRSAGVPSQMFDAVPLAAEPFAAALDLVLAAAGANFAREPALALLRSPHFAFPGDSSRRDLVVLDRALSDAGYLGGFDVLTQLIAAWSAEGRVSAAAQRAAAVLHAIATDLQPLGRPAPPAAHLDHLLAFLERHARLPAADDPLRARLLRARAAILDILTTLRGAHARFDAIPVPLETTAALIKQWIEEHTFAPHTGEGGVHVIDADSARFGDFDIVQLAGLVEGEWPEAPRRNIFYPPALLRELGWPSEAERLEGARAAFSDLLRLPSSAVVVSAFALENDTLVAASPLLDAVASASLSTTERTLPQARVFEHEALAFEPVDAAHLAPVARTAAARRRDAAAQPRPRSGATSGHRPAAYSVSALERYQDCPFKYFANDVLRLEEPLEDEPARSPRARGRFVHEVFQRFFEAWQARGGGTIGVDEVDDARALFVRIAEPMLGRLPEADAALERARLFGSAVSAGIVDVVLDLEASRPAEVRERWIEYRLEGEFSLGAADGRRIPIKGMADRIDLLAGHRLRVIDYKSGYPPNPKRALQLPVYALCAQERLAERDGLAWAVEEAAYVAFGGRRPLVPVVRRGDADADAVLAGARARLLHAVDRVERGEFPPRPHELRLCRSCAFPSVCRKDYVGDE